MSMYIYIYVYIYIYIYILLQSSLHRYIKQKILQSPGTITFGKRTNKLKQSEIEVTMIMKMKNIVYAEIGK